MTASRAVAVGLLALAVALVAFVLLRGNGERTYRLKFQTAGQLVNDNDVQIGGRRIGSVKKIELTDDNQAQVTIVVQRREVRVVEVDTPSPSPFASSLQCWASMRPSLVVPVRSQIVVNSAPAVGQLELLVQDYERMGVLLADRQRST